MMKKTMNVLLTMLFLLSFKASCVADISSSTTLVTEEDAEARYSHRCRNITVTGPIGPIGPTGAPGATGASGVVNAIYTNFYSTSNQTLFGVQPFVASPDDSAANVTFGTTSLGQGITESLGYILFPTPGDYVINWELTALSSPLGAGNYIISFGLFFINGETADPIVGSNFAEIYPSFGMGGPLIPKQVIGQAIVRTTVSNQLIALKNTSTSADAPPFPILITLGGISESVPPDNFQNVSASIVIRKLN